MSASTTTDNILLCPFTVCVDTREQAPYSFDNVPSWRGVAGRLIIKTVYRGLPTGDYSIEGFEQRVAVERKSLEDLYATLGQGRERFEREFAKLNALNSAAVIIEAGWQEIIRPREARGAAWRSRLLPRSVWATIFAWSQRFPRVHWYTMGSRRLAELATFEILSRFWREENN